jgi:hypothetical protein
MIENQVYLKAFAYESGYADAHFKTNISGCVRTAAMKAA